MSCCNRRREDPSDRIPCETFVKYSSLVLTIVILAVACVHMHYLFEAFVAKQRIQDTLTSGKDLDTKDTFLWCLLFTFGEADWDSHDPIADRYYYDLRIWKLSGLSSAYVLAMTVNMALFAATACADRFHHALFIPWIVVNLVAVLAFFSLTLGILIVHLAYGYDEGRAGRKDGDSGLGVFSSLIPLGLAVFLCLYWLVVVKVYLAKVRLGNERNDQRREVNNRHHSDDDNDEEMNVKNRRKQNGEKQDEIGEQTAALMQNIDFVDSDSVVSDSQKQSSSQKRYSLSSTLEKKPKDKRNGDKSKEHNDAENGVQNGFANGVTVVQVERKRLSQLEKAEIVRSPDDGFASRSPFLPELREDYKLKHKKRQCQTCLDGTKEDKEDHYCVQDEVKQPLSNTRPLSSSEEVNLWTEFDGTTLYDQSYSQATLDRQSRRFSRKSRHCEDMTPIPFSPCPPPPRICETKSVHFNYNTELGNGKSNGQISPILRRSRSSLGENDLNNRNGFRSARSTSYDRGSKKRSARSGK